MAARGLRGRKEVEDPNNTWDMQLMAACLKGDTTEAANLLVKGAKIDHTAADAQGRMVTPFLAVAQKGADIETLHWIAAEANGNPNPQYNGDQGTVFHQLVRHDQLELLEKLASNNENISPQLSLKEVDSTGQTPTQLAINLHKPEAARILIRNGSSHPFQSLVDAIHCQTARACATGQTQLLETLFQAGDNPFQKDCNGQTLMHLAVQHPAILDVLLDRGVNINATNWQGQTPLLYVVQNVPKAVEVVDALVARGADVNIGDNLNMTPLMHAIVAYNPLMIKKLLDCKADINVRDQFGGSALHWAVVARQKGALELLLSLEADVNAVDRNGESPLHRACTKGCYSAVTLLLGRDGVDINIADTQGRVPLHAAVQECQVSIVQQLLKRCSDDNPFSPASAEKGGGKKPPAGGKKSGAPAAAETQFATKLNIEAQDANGNTALQLAVALNHTELVKMLVETGANVRRPSPQHGTLLHEAVYEGNESIVETLLNARAKVDARDAHDLTPLHTASRRGLVVIASLLLKASATVDLQDCNNLQSALHIAAECSDEPLVELLLSAGKASTTLTDRNVRTALHLAALNGCVPVIKLLLSAGSRSFKSPDIDGWTPLHCVCSVDCADAIPLLTAKETVTSQGGIEVTTWETFLGDMLAKDVKGWVPLHVAVASGSTHCTAMLLDMLKELTLQNEKFEKALPPNDQVSNPHHVEYSFHKLVGSKKSGESLKSVLASAAGAATPYALARPRNELLEILNLADKLDRTPFILAAEYGHPAAAKLLLAAKKEEQARGTEFC